MLKDNKKLIIYNKFLSVLHTNLLVLLQWKLKISKVKKL